MQEVGDLASVQFGEAHVPKRRQHIRPQPPSLLLRGAERASMALEINLDEVRDCFP